VNTITDFTDSTSEHELFAFLYDRIVNHEITAFSKLKEFAAPVLRNPKSHPVMMRCYELIKKLNWGFFEIVTPETHKRLWKEIVIPDKQFPEAGDLKTTLQISNLYVAMLDIHGYTQFCMDSRKNLSMMHTLDWAINNEIRNISTKCQAVSQRERGDEIVVVAASASDALNVTLCIVDYFGKTNIVDDPNIPTRRNGPAEALPSFKITGGITGGNTQSPLIITEKGNLSGFLLNSGARLQTRANELSPKESRVMVAKQVHMNYIKENEKEKCSLFRNEKIYFLDTGQIEFKGVMIPTCEAVFYPQDRYKENFSEELTKLFGSIKDNLWEQRIFMDLLELLSRSAHVMPKFTVVPPSPINGMQTITNESFFQLSRMALKAYNIDEDYAAAVDLLKTYIFLIEQIPQYERLVLDYLRGVTNKYDMLLKSYNETIEKEIDARAQVIFQGNSNYYKAWVASKNAVNVYEKLKNMGRKSPEIPKKKALWLSLIKQNADKMEFVLHSGKK
jgi:hypothetical protein